MNPIYTFPSDYRGSKLSLIVHFRSLCNFGSLSDVLLCAKEQGLMLFKPCVCVCMCVCARMHVCVCVCVNKEQ